jgi:hypothetical protein
MAKNSIAFEVGNKVTVMVDGKVFRVGVISEFKGEIVVVHTPTSIIHCNVLLLKHYEDNDEREL